MRTAATSASGRRKEAHHGGPGGGGEQVLPTVSRQSSSMWLFPVTIDYGLQRRFETRKLKEYQLRGHGTWFQCEERTVRYLSALRTGKGPVERDKENVLKAPGNTRSGELTNHSYVGCSSVTSNAE